MKKKSRWIVAVGLVLALVLMLAPTQVLAVDVPVDPNGPYGPGAGTTFTVDIDIGDVSDLCAVDLEVGYDNTVIDFVAGSAVKGGIWGGATVIVTETDFADSIKIGLQNTGCNPMTPGVSGPGTLVQLDFFVVGSACDYSDLDMSSYAATNKLFNRFGMEIAASWGDSSVTVEPCGGPCAAPPTVVSGIEVPGAPGSAEPGAWVPAGFEPCDEFQPCEMLYVWGEGDPCHFCNWYRIWIQPYGPYGDMPDPSVVDGQVLDPELCPPGFPPEGIWVDVHVGEDGKFGPVAIWHVDGEYCELWEIVADKLEDGGTVGVYDCEWDGLDAACVGEWGFHIYPEGLTIILVSLGLVAVGGYILVVRRRRGAETDLDL